MARDIAECPLRVDLCPSQLARPSSHLQGQQTDRCRRPYGYRESSRMCERMIKITTTSYFTTSVVSGITQHDYIEPIENPGL